MLYLSDIDFSVFGREGCGSQDDDIVVSYAKKLSKRDYDIFQRQKEISEIIQSDTLKAPYFEEILNQIHEAAKTEHRENLTIHLQYFINILGKIVSFTSSLRQAWKKRFSALSQTHPALVLQLLPVVFSTNATDKAMKVYPIELKSGKLIHIVGYRNESPMSLNALKSGFTSFSGLKFQKYSNFSPIKSYH